MYDLPSSVQLAAERVGLPDFLEDVAIGFHWDMLDRLEEGVYLVDRDRRLRYWSAGAQRISGYSADEVLGRSCFDNILRHVDDCGQCLCVGRCPLQATIHDGRPRSAEVFLHHKAGHRVPVRVYAAPIRDRDGRTIGAFETFADTTPKLAYIERIQSLKQIAYVDPLTGLANRRFMNSALDSRLAALARGEPGFGLLLIDIDHFKRFNDQHGHETGDRVLAMVARTLAHAAHATHIVGRWGGEEFLVLVDSDDLPSLLSQAERLRRLIEASTHEQQGLSLKVTISVGATLAKPDDDPQRLVARADELLYQSKSAGRNRVSAA